MTKVFVHGVPETSAIWRPLIAELNRRGVSDVVTLSPPGFGVASGATWQPSQAAYREWLTKELVRIGGQIDLVGHDWGAGHVYGVVTENPGLVTSWAADCGGLLHPNYVWHDMAQAWQTPDVGEQAIQAMTGASDDDKATLLQSIGMSPDIARDSAPWLNDDMASCILALYRSAAQPAMTQLGKGFRDSDQSRGMIIIPVDDPYPGTPEMAEEVARSAGATSVRLHGVGHWWMIHDPMSAADALLAHWRR